MNSPPQLTGIIIVTLMLAQTNLESQSMAAREASNSPCFSLEMKALLPKAF